jgi:1,4-alpha-glucan branching enzyme
VYVSLLPFTIYLGAAGCQIRQRRLEDERLPNRDASSYTQEEAFCIGGNKEFEPMVIKVARPDGTVRVTFVVPEARFADSVHVVGEFNEWNTTSHPLLLGEHGWQLTLELPAGRCYAYHYLLNNRDWHNDWQADGYAPNAYGGDSSLLDLRRFAAAPQLQDCRCPQYAHSA